MYRFLLLGEPVLEGPEGRSNILSRKGQALLWYCAAQPEREFSRSTLAELFWEASLTRLDSLGMALTRLRRELPVWPLRATRQVVGWDHGSGVFLDVRRFNEVLERNAEDEDVESLEEAARLWRGSFLEGFDPAGSEDIEIWLTEQRAYWEERIFEVLGRLVRLREKMSEWEGVIVAAQRALKVDPLREAFHRSLIQGYYSLGDRAAALSRYAACRELLQDELGVEPDETTQALGEAINQSPPPVFIPSLRPFSAPELAGQEAALGLIGATLARAETAAQRVVLLAGEAGTDKARLVGEISGWDAPKGHPNRAVLRGCCREDNATTPLAPFVEILRNSLRKFPSAWEDLPKVWLREIGRLLPEAYPNQPNLPDEGPEDGPHRLTEAVERLLLALPRPFLLVLEEIHWADPSTFMLLGRLARREAPGMVLLLTVQTGKISEAAQRFFAQLKREGRLVRQEVAPPKPNGSRQPRWRLVWKT